MPSVAMPFHLAAQAGAAAASAEPAPRYWPGDVLHSFTLLMAADGHCVSAALMLGDRDYALDQLAHAHTSGDDGLRALAVRMFSYFDAPALHA